LRIKSKYFTQKGVALLAASVAIAITSVMVTEFSTNTTIDFYAAANARDSMKAHFLARSAQNLAHLIIRVQTDVIDKYRKYLGDIQIADYTGMFLGAFGGSQEEAQDVAALLGTAEGEKIKGLGLEPGNTFDVQITTEDSKINLNCANGSQQSRDNLKTKLEALFYFEVFNPIFENPDAEGYRRDRLTQVTALIDYVDRDKYKFDAPGNPEDYGYESLRDDYEAKNNYLDTVGEIKLIRGVDDRFWKLFGKQFTVYGSCKENVGSLDDPMRIAPLIFLAAKNPDDPILRDPARLWLLAKTVAEARQFGVFFDDLSGFAKFVQNPAGSLTDMLAGAGMDSSAMSSVDPALQQLQGVELDTNKLNQIAEAGPRRTYRVEAIGTVTRVGDGTSVTRRIESVWDTNTQNQNMRNPAYGRGAWVFWREE